MKFQARDLNEFRELINSGVRRAASLLSELLDIEVQLQVPVVRTYVLSGLVMPLLQHTDERFTVIELDFSGAYQGKAALIFPADTVQNLTRVFLSNICRGYDPETTRNGTIHEMGNVLINGIMGEIAGYLGESLTYTLPQFLQGDSETLLEVLRGNRKAILLAHTHFVIPDYQIREEVLLLIDISAFGEFMETVRTRRVFGPVENL